MAKLTIWVVTVRDTWTGFWGEFCEQTEVNTKGEAKAWAKQWRKEYPYKSGYRVRIEPREYEAGDPAEPPGSEGVNLWNE